MQNLSDTALNANDRQALERAAEILRARFPVQRLVLFGSKARGDDHTESDIDLLVLTTRSVAPAEKAQMTDALYPIELEHGIVISKWVVTAEEWDSGVSQALPIRKEIEREGVSV